MYPFYVPRQKLSIDCLFKFIHFSYNGLCHGCHQWNNNRIAELLICLCIAHYNLEFETEIVAAFSESGIEVVAYSNVEIEAQPPFIEYIYAVALENDCRYAYIVSISEAYSYDYGGGISRINFNSTMADLDMTGIPLRITGAITCKENIFHSYIESLEPACKCMVEALVNEYMKYVIASEPVMAE